MKVLLIDNRTTLLEKLQKLIPGDEVIARFDSLRGVHVDEFDLVVLSGGSSYCLEENVSKFSDELNFVRNTTKPIIGICFGFELIVRAFGGKLIKLENKDKGIKEIEISDRNLYKKLRANVYESHEWSVEHLPDFFRILAKSPTGPEIIKHKSRSIYGFQFHPENFVDTLEGDEIFLKIFSEIQSGIKPSEQTD